VLPAGVAVEELRAYRNALEKEIHLLAFRAGAAVGAAFGVLEHPHALRRTALATVLVLAEERRHGTGSALLEAVSGWTGACNLEALEGYVLADDADGLSWSGRRGFRDIGRESWLGLDLAGVTSSPGALPAGVSIATRAERPDLDRSLYDVACEAYADIPGHEGDQMEPFEDWLAHDMNGVNDRPEATFLAVAEGDVVGYAKFHIPLARPGVALHDLTAVRRAWRGRGIAGALKRAQIAWAKAAGYETLETWNELRNEPIRRLNERLGYRPTRERVLFHGPLTRPAAR